MQSPGWQGTSPQTLPALSRSARCLPGEKAARHLLSQGKTQIEGLILTHFDEDHVGGLYYILNEIKVKKVCISKQYESTENYKKFLKIAKEKNIEVIVLKINDILEIEKDVKFQVLFPEENLIQENSTNNNALVIKLIYRDFKMLFTGDIEKIAEQKMVNLYKNTNILESDILKVAHHGSKTSTTQEFLNLVNPKIALIGVGEDNRFGHPSNEVVNLLESINAKVYRTDQNGEISIVVNNQGKIKKVKCELP